MTQPWYQALIIEDGLIDTVFDGVLERFDGMMKGSVGRCLAAADQCVLDGLSFCFGFASNSIRGQMTAAPSLALVKSEEEPVSSGPAYTPKLQHALSSTGLDFSGISGFSDVDDSIRGCASPLLYVSHMRTAAVASDGMSLMRA